MCLHSRDSELARRKLGQSVYVFLGARPPFRCFHKDTEQLQAAELAGFKDAGRTDMDQEAQGAACSLLFAESEVRRCCLARLSEAGCVSCDPSLQLSRWRVSARSQQFQFFGSHSSPLDLWNLPQQHRCGVARRKSCASEGDAAQPSVTSPAVKASMWEISVSGQVAKQGRGSVRSSKALHSGSFFFCR